MEQPYHTPLCRQPGHTWPASTLQPCRYCLLTLQVAHTFARYDLPVPGGPYSRMPLHGLRLPARGTSEGPVMSARSLNSCRSTQVRLQHATSLPPAQPTKQSRKGKHMGSCSHSLHCAFHCSFHHATDIVSTAHNAPQLPGITVLLSPRILFVNPCLIPTPDPHTAACASTTVRGTKHHIVLPYPIECTATSCAAAHL